MEAVSDKDWKLSHEWFDDGGTAVAAPLSRGAFRETATPKGFASRRRAVTTEDVDSSTNENMT
jgi:hypothetical protein